jgi:sugar phosphate isomerase/epimerase
MSSAPLARLAIHTATTRPLPLPVACDEYVAIGATGITVWRDALQLLGVEGSAKVIKASGLKPVALCRGGFFVSPDASARAAALDDNRKALDEAAAIGAGMVVLVCGAAKGVPLSEARNQIRGAIEALLPHAEKTGVNLAIEPLHPMYAADRSAVNTLGQANDLVEAIRSPKVGVALDVYHVWWDERLESEIARCARLKGLMAFHVCDYRSPTRDLLNDRGLPGDGVIDIKQIRRWVESAGFSGHIEVEVFSTEYWSMDQRKVLQKLKQSYLDHV